jgi:hypothetical protein
MTLLLVAFLVAILLVGGMILFLVTRGSGSSELNKDCYRKDWLNIEQQLVKTQEASYQIVILNADKLLDKALKQRGYKGDTMGERMRSAKDIWSNANAVWTVHKLRNQIAHEHDVKVRYDTVRRSLAVYKQALKDVGAI